MFGKANTDVSMKEVLGAVSRLKCGKTSGVDEVKAEYLKSGGYVCAEWMVRLLNVCMSSGRVPKEEKMGALSLCIRGTGTRWN